MKFKENEVITKKGEKFKFDYNKNNVKVREEVIGIYEEETDTYRMLIPKENVEYVRAVTEEEIEKETVHKEGKYGLVSKEERIILENIAAGYDWITRNGGGEIYVCTDKPKRYENYWMPKGSIERLSAFDHLFRFVNRRNEEPINFRELLKGDNE